MNIQFYLTQTYKWVLLKNGEKTAEGAFDAVVAADSRKDVKLSIPKVSSEAGVEYYLQVFAYQKKATEFIPEGFEVAKEEFAFPTNNYFAESANADGAVKVEKKEDKVIVTSGDVTYEFSTKEGRSLLAMKDGKDNVFYRTPSLNFWRASTDNDFGAGTQYKSLLWNAASHNQKTVYKNMTEKDGVVTFSYEVRPIGVEAKVDMTYTVNKDGSLTVKADYKALSDNLPEMVRFGMMMTLPKSVNDFTWYGRGPLENYIDRNKDSFMGVWNGKVEDQAYPYYRPQETGNKTDVRWFTLQNENGKGIKVTGAQPLSVSATNNRPEDLDPGTTKKQQHWSDVLPLNETVLCVDLFQKGVAGLNSWGAQPLDQYRFHGKEYSYSYTISVIK